LIKEKLGIRQKMMFEEAEFEIVRQNNAHVNYKDTIRRLPYVFKDPIEFDKKIDPRKLQFGSKISFHTAKRKKYTILK
jgi:hypothetical protein